MAQLGNFANGDYFIDCPSNSETVLRAIVGVWIFICTSCIALCIRFIFRSHIQRHITLGPQGGVSIWRVSPAVTPSEAFEMRGILAKALMKRDFAFVFVSLFCIVTAVACAAGTFISNHVVQTNTVVRDANVTGRLITNDVATLAGTALVQISARVDALDNANAPRNELFDFVPNDDSKWVYKSSQWNNTWKTRENCSFVKHEAVELVVHPTNSGAYQDEVPLLGNYIPPWATVDPTKQGVAYAGFYDGAGNSNDSNSTGAWRDRVVTYFFRSTPVGDGTPEKNMNISIVNYLAHQIARDEESGFLETAFRSDIYTAECQFVRAVVVNGSDQSGAYSDSYQDVVGSINSLYNSAVVNASILNLPIPQPTGQDMLRYWQAYTSVKDATLPHYVERILPVRKPVVQIRLSFLVVTIGAFLFASIAAGLARIINHRNGVWKIHVPSSQLEWLVQAAREHVHYHADPTKSTPRDSFASSSQDLAFITTPDLESRIATVHEWLNTK